MSTQRVLDFFIECKDHTVSEEKFRLLYDIEYDMLVTSPKPNESELGKYYESEDYISHTDGKRNLLERLYQIVKTYSLSKKVDLITKLNVKPGKILDIGSGTGDFLAVAKKKKWEINGVEPNLTARKLAEQKGVYLQSNSLGYEPQSFDVITMWHVLEHVPDIQVQIEELKRLLKPNGYLIIAVPNFKSYDAAYYKSFWAAYDVPRHLWHFSKKAIEKLFIKENLKMIKILPMKFDSFYVSLLSEKYKNGKMNYIKAFWIGWYSNMRAKRSKEYSSHIYVLKNS
ncbi:class I SAM-dependent methyltransferase [Aquimarina sp. 2201CG5-10]|uniref:class I SAM-dependent methyltransferase n=1 Tax=Aquimarina callyspongiae TaxID=3098150 RepID=UPI002AB4D353|nr:class I SAM-dependent methyltransferase [Aquimarina sp. 2201CG5-10]MDY8135328.1 class I SAM-dependent methyltransferase [Aquimarina sp. 2201CG5-10]